MQILDGKNHQRGAFEKVALDVIVGLLNTGKYWGWISFPPTSSNYTPEQIRLADTAFLTTLRALVDQWINSGIREDGVETPSRRNVRPAPEGYLESLFDILLGWLSRNVPKPALMGDGKIGILDRRPEPYGLEVDVYARETAVYYLKELLECPAPHRLRRCKKCGVYFARERERKGDIKRGSYCGKCEPVGATERTRLSRRRRKNQQLDAAAQAWPHWAKSRRHPNRAEWVAQQVNKRIQTGTPIQAKCVTQNKGQILERLNERAQIVVG